MWRSRSFFYLVTHSISQLKVTHLVCVSSRCWITLRAHFQVECIIKGPLQGLGCEIRRAGLRYELLKSPNRLESNCALSTSIVFGKGGGHFSPGSCCLLSNLICS